MSVCVEVYEGCLGVIRWECVWEVGEEGFEVEECCGSCLEVYLRFVRIFMWIVYFLVVGSVLGVSLEVKVWEGF